MISLLIATISVAVIVSFSLYVVFRDHKRKTLLKLAIEECSKASDYNSYSGETKHRIVNSMLKRCKYSIPEDELNKLITYAYTNYVKGK
jgi:cobalamin biosynthesis Co2+ chelatase CbiK